MSKNGELLKKSVQKSKGCIVVQQKNTLQDQKHRGLMFVLSSPSGAGKSTLSRLLIDDSHLKMSVSVTTRERRHSEVDGMHYHFISIQEFEKKRDNDELIEWARVHDNYYGTLKKTVETTLSSGHDLLFDIDFQGAKQLQKKMPDDVVSIFILPPSMVELEARLHRRAEDSPAVIAKRLENSQLEMQKWQDYDYVLINEDVQKSLASLKIIYQAESMKRKRCLYLEDFVKKLTA